MDSAALAIEGCQPTNNAIDPGETVLISVAFKNIGNGNTTNFVATLLQTNGVVAPGGPQTYGVLLSGGASVTQAFSLTATGSCGGTITATFQLQDGAVNLGTATATFGLGQTLTVLTQSFDTGVTVPALPSGWTTFSGGGLGGWYTTNSTADTTPNAAFSADVGSTGSNELDSVAFVLPNGPSLLSFKNRYDLEVDPAHATNGYDGGVLEIKIGTNAYVDITNAGGVFLSGGYNAKISNLYSNPFSGRWAWSGNSGGYVSTVVSMPPSAAGQTVQLRWRCGTDNGTSANGWRIDSISVTGSSCCANAAPILPNQSDHTIAELSTMLVTNTATDTPGQPLSYNLLVGPTNASISTNGIISWTPNEGQGPSTNNIFTTVVSDGGTPPLTATNTFRVAVTEVNSSPTISLPPDQTINELALWTGNATATDTDLPPNKLTFELVSGPAGLAVNATNGVMSWTPTEAQGPGFYTVTVRVYDDGAPVLTNTSSFHLTVNEVNSAPALTLPPSQTINELALWTANATAIDTDQPPNNLTFELVSGPGGLSVSPAGLISWTPTEAQGPGSYSITVRVYDDGQPKLSTTNSFNLTVNEVNSAPILTLPPDQTISEQVLWTANATAIDTDLPPNNLTFELVSGPGGLTVSPAGLISWTPSESQGPSTNVVKVRVYDDAPSSLSVTGSFTLTVSEVNTAPVLSLPPDQTINELALWTANATAIDTDLPPNILTFELVSGPNGLTVATNGAISWTPGENQGPSTNTVTIRVYDDGTPRLSMTNSFVLTVNEVNSAPMLTLPSDQTIDELVLWTANATAIDTDLPPNHLTFELVSGPSGLTVDTNGLIKWQPTEDQGPGTNLVTIRVYDNGAPAISVTNSFTVVVQEVNVAPVLPNLPDLTIADTGSITVTNSATDDDRPANLLFYTLITGPTNATIDAYGVITWAPTPDQAPSTNVFRTWVVDDGKPPLSATNTFTVTVTPPKPGPFSASIVLSNGMAIVTWDSVPGRSYKLQYKDDITDSTWTDAPPDITATGGKAAAALSQSGIDRRYYRVMLLP